MSALDSLNQSLVKQKPSQLVSPPTLQLEPRDKKYSSSQIKLSMANSSSILLILLASNLVILLFNPPLESKSSTTAAFDPLDFILSRLSTILALYLSFLPYSKHKPSFKSLLFAIRRTWHRPALTLLRIELHYTASASLLLMLKSVAKAVTTIRSSAISETCVISGSIGLILYLWPVLFEHSEIACKMSLVMSVTVGEREWEGIREATKRAGAMVEGRKLEGFILTTVMTMVERATASYVMRLGVRMLVWLVYTGFYYECEMGSHR